MKGSSVLQNISKGMSSLQKGCVNIFDSQVGRDNLSLQELKKGILVYSQAEGQGPPSKTLSMIIIIEASQRKSFQHGVRIGFLFETQESAVFCLLVTEWSHPPSTESGAEVQAYYMLTLTSVLFFHPSLQP